MGWIANVLFVAGVYVLGQKRRVGFVYNGIANLLYAVIGLRTGLWDLLVISLVMTGLNIWNWWKWRPKAPRPQFIFSKRVALAEEVDAWLKEHKAHRGSLGVITALQALGHDLHKREGK